MKQKTPDISADAKAQISETLPQAIETAIASYQQFMDMQQNTESSKEYKEQNTAAKAGLAHIELLLKLATMVEIVDENKAEDIIERIKNAQKELDNNV